MEDILEMETKNNKVELDKGYIKSLIQLILNKSHTIDQKKRIIEHRDRLNFSCPICGDSEKNNSKKRGNLYFSNMRYICFNDETCSRSFYKLLKTYNIEMGLDEKLQLNKYIDENITYSSTEDVQFDNLDKLFNINDLTEFYSDKKHRHITKLRPLQNGSVVEQYIRKIRKVKYTEDIYEADFWITDKWHQPVMVYLNKLKDKVISLQVRNLLEGDKRMFKIYDFSKIFFEMYPEGELDDQEKISYDKLSHFFNIFKVDFSNNVNIFEGYIDSLFLPNSIGMIGVNTDLSFLLKEDGLELRFIFDNDKAGLKKSRQMIEEHRKVFLWNKFFIDFIKNYKGKLSKQELVDKLKDIKDFNQLSKKFRKPIHQIFNINEYFSIDDFDIYYIENTLQELSKSF